MSNYSEKKSTETAQSKPETSKIIDLLLSGWIDVWHDLQDRFIGPFLQLENTTRPGIIIMVSVIVTWFLYVPIHELLHVAGCVWTGGTVTELVMGNEYGAGFLKEIFPFITPATTKYAGRVTGFEPNGDVGYLITVFAPFILTLFPGVWCFKTACQKQRYWLMGPAIVIGLASFYNLTGDFFEMGTILSTRLTNLLWGGMPDATYANFWLLRSDDIFRLFTEINTAPSAYGVDTGPGRVITGIVIAAGLAFAIMLAGYVYRAGRMIAVWKK